MDFLIAADHRLFRIINGWNHPVLDFLLGWPTHLGRTVVVLSLIFLALAIYGFRHPFFWRRYGYMVLCVMVTNIIVQVMKFSTGRLRPVDFFKGVDAEGLTFMFAEHTKAFPSGHAATMFAVAVLVNKIYKGRLPLLYLAAVWIGITRIYVGAHFPSDVLAGALIGAFIGAIFARFLPSQLSSQSAES